MSELELHNGQMPASEPVRHPWEKRPGESVKAFLAFAVYRDLGYYRTLQKVADEFKISLDQIKGWSSANDWRERVELYEMERDRRRIEAEFDAQAAVRKAEGIAGRSLMRSGLQRLQGDAESGVMKLDPNEFDVADVVKVITEGARLQRMEMGMPMDFSKAALSMSFQEVGSLVKDLVQGLLPLIPPERHNQAFAVIRSVALANPVTG